MQTQQATEPVTESVTDLSYVDITPKGIYAALAKAQGQVGTIAKDSSAGKGAYSYTYASLAAVLSAVNTPLSSNGICLLQTPITREDSLWVEVQTTLVYEDGSSVSCKPGAKAKATDPQSIGSAITYLRRYGLMSLMGIAAEDDDDDGKAASQPRQPQQSRGPHERSKRPVSTSSTHRAQQSRAQQPTTVETPRAQNGAAPPLQPTAETIRRFWTTAKTKLGWEEYNVYDVLGLDSIKELTDQDMVAVTEYMEKEAKGQNASIYKPDAELPNHEMITDLVNNFNHSWQHMEELWAHWKLSWKEHPWWLRYSLSRRRYELHLLHLERVSDSDFEEAWSNLPERYRKGKASDIWKTRMRKIRGQAA